MGTVAGIAAGGGILYTAAKKGGKWAVVKALAVAAAAAAAEQGVEKGLRTAGASDEAIHGARLAATVIAFILLRRKNLRGRVTAAQRGTHDSSGSQTRGKSRCLGLGARCSGGDNTRTTWAKCSKDISSN